MTASFPRRCRAPDVLRSAPCPGCGNFCSLEEPIAPPRGPASIFWHCPVRRGVANQRRVRIHSKSKEKPPTSSGDGDDASVAQVCAKPFDATLHEDQLTLDFKNLSVLTQRFTGTST